MRELIREEANLTRTENGALTYRSTGSDCLDLFATIGAIRAQSDNEILARFTRAYVENPDLAMKLLFYARDIRGGLGERRVFRVILRDLANDHPSSVKKNISYIAEYGRYDDILSLLGTRCEKEAINYLRDTFEKDMTAMESGTAVSLLGKWLPSINASNVNTVAMAVKLAKAFGLSNGEYRKALSALRREIKIIENNLREKDYSFDYSKQPSRAMFKYREAFRRNDEERYFEFLSRVSKGEAKLHADNVAPYELVEPYLGYHGMRSISQGEKDTLNATWASLPDFSGDDNALAVVDTSGSMYCDYNPKPASVALSLGIYLAEHCRGEFANCFIEFSEAPKFIEIKGETFVDKLKYVSSFNVIANTNISGVFNLILSAAVKNNVPQSELPGKLVIISDMEFDSCVDDGKDISNYEHWKKEYASHGYELPSIVFWNVASRAMQQPVKKNEAGVALVSGTTPILFEMVAGDDLSPYKLMMDVLGSERYSKIAA